MKTAAHATAAGFSVGRRTLGIGLAATVMAAGAYAYTAGNTFTGDNRAGDGQSAVSGYEVSNIHYALNDTDPTLIDAVTFDLDNAATTVKAGTDVSGYVNCGVTTGDTWTCDFSAAPPSVAAVESLNVIAAS